MDVSIRSELQRHYYRGKQYQPSYGIPEAFFVQITLLPFEHLVYLFVFRFLIIPSHLSDPHHTGKASSAR